MRCADRIRKKSVVYGLILSVVFAGSVFAYWQQSADTLNILTMASYKAEIVEKYRQPSCVVPSESVEKRVDVKNSGTVDILVRVAVKKMFGTRNGGVFEEDKALDGEMIEIRFASEYWRQGTDGWFYYKDVLKAGEKTREPLMKSFRLSEKAGNVYQGKEAHIVVTMESIQADENAGQIWGTQISNTGIIWPKAPRPKETAVEFCGKDRGFVITGEGTDLFAMFKNLTPGCGRTQQIRLKNSSEEKTELFLHAETADQGQSGEMTKQLLQKYAEIELLQGEELLYSGPVGTVEPGGYGDKEISLGSFDAGAEKMLTVKLTLSPEMDNRFQSLTGKVKWVFTARGEDGTSTVAAVPVTGDSVQAGRWIMLCISSAVFAGIISLKKRRQGGEK